MFGMMNKKKSKFYAQHFCLSQYEHMKVDLISSTAVASGILYLLESEKETGYLQLSMYTAV